MIAVIRIKGQTGIRRDVIETFQRMGLKKKYSCIVLDKLKKEESGMIEKIRNFSAFGEIDSEMYKKLVEKRGFKPKAAKTAQINNSRIKKFKQVFRLHPPRGGIESKKHFGVGKGVLGDHGKEISKLIERML